MVTAEHCKGRAVCELLRMDLHIGKADMRILKLCDALNVSYVNNVSHYPSLSSSYEKHLNTNINVN